MLRKRAGETRHSSRNIPGEKENTPSDTPSAQPSAIVKTDRAPSSENTERRSERLPAKTEGRGGAHAMVP